MKRLHKLLFELASAERMNVMLELPNNKLKLSQLSRKLKLTVTETSRHLQRLNEAKLIQKNSDGFYELTGFGKLTLILLENLDFVSEYRDFFLEYDISGIPRHLVDRFSELGQGVYVTQALRNLEEGERSVREAQNFVWILSDDVLTNTIPILIQKVHSPFDLRIILPEGKFPPESVSQLPMKVVGIQKRVVPKVNVLVVITDSLAIFCLPNRSGRIDYTGLQGKDIKFRDWCKDLFLYYWEKAKPINGN